MHELSLAMNILDLATEEAEARDATSVLAIHLRLGPMSGVIKSALVSAFELAREDSTIPNAELIVEDVPLVMYCDQCQSEQTLDCVNDFCCPACGIPSGNIISGRELEIVAMEIEP